jgi:flagellar biosynthetic protein FliR
MFDANFLLLTQDKLVVGMLILTRISGLFISGLFFGHTSIPLTLKAGIILMLTLIMTPIFYAEAPAIQFEVLNMSFLVLKEFLVGAILGFASNIVY